MTYANAERNFIKAAKDAVFKENKTEGTELMRLWKRCMATVCAMAMIAGVSACGTEKQQDNTESKEQAGTSTAEDGRMLLNEPGTYPIVNEPVTLKVMIMSKPYIEDYNTNDFTKWIEELTGINLEIEAVTYEDSQEKMTLAMSGGEYPDVFMMLEPDIVKYGVKEGMFLPLDDLIEENMPNFMEKASGVRDSLRQSDGKIYGMPSINEAYHVMYGNKMWMNSDKLSKLGLETPTTTQELYDVCKAYLEKEPDGVCIAGESESTNRAVNWLLNAFILTPDEAHGAHDKVSDVKCILSPEGKVISVLNQPQYKEGLKYIRSLYDLGAFYEGTFSYTLDNLKSLVNQEGEPVLFFPYLYSAKLIDSTADNELYRHYEVLSPVEGPEGVRVTPYYYNDGLYENRFVITDKCEYPEVALRFLDWFYQEKSYVMSQYGTEEGVDFIWEPEGEVGVNGEPAMYTLLNGYTTDVQNHDWQVTSLFYGTAKVRLGESIASDLDKYSAPALEKLLYEESVEKMQPYAPKEGDYNILPVLHLTAEEIDEIAIPLVEVSNYMRQSQAAFITGKMDIEKDWDAYVEELDSLGLQKILDVYQKVCDR